MAESEFTVLESYTRDVGCCVVRIDKNTMDDLSIVSEDIVEIMGKQRAVAKCLQLYPADEGKKIVRIDGLIRNNCKAEIGDIVSIKETKSVVADSVMVAPLEAMPPLDPRYLANALESAPVVPEQFVMFNFEQVICPGTVPEIRHICLFCICPGSTLTLSLFYL